METTVLLKELIKIKEKQSFQVKYLGCETVIKPGEEDVTSVMQNLTFVSKYLLKKVPYSNLQLSLRGIEIFDNARTGKSVLFPIDKIIYCAVDKSQSNVFCFVLYRRPMLECHVLSCKTKKCAKRLALELGVAFQRASQSKLKEEKSQEKHKLQTKSKYPWQQIKNTSKLEH